MHAVSCIKLEQMKKTPAEINRHMIECLGNAQLANLFNPFSA